MKRIYLRSLSLLLALLMLLLAFTACKPDASGDPSQDDPTLPEQPTDDPSLPTTSGDAFPLGDPKSYTVVVSEFGADAEEDAARGRYNPFLLLYGHVPTDGEREGIEIALKNELFSAEAAFDLIEFDCEDFKSIVYNILYLGMPGRIGRINREKGCEKKRKGRKKHEESV